VAPSSKNLGTLLVLFSTNETGSPNLRARIYSGFFKNLFPFFPISLSEFSALPDRRMICQDPYQMLAYL
jgi:hypothetical protein